MTRRSIAVRGLWLVAAALQLLLPGAAAWADARLDAAGAHATAHVESHTANSCARLHAPDCALCHFLSAPAVTRSEEHTSELQSRLHLVCRLLLEKKKIKTMTTEDNRD